MIKYVKVTFPRSFFEMLFLVRQLYNTSTHGFPPTISTIYIMERVMHRRGQLFAPAIYF